MGALMVRCPATGRRLSLGVDLDAVTLDRTLDFVATFQCGACAGEHPWSKADAWIGAAEFTPSTRTETAAAAPPSVRSLRGGRRVPADCWGMPLAA
jgi:hypothetical protein